MALKRKRDKFKKWLASLFAPKDESHYIPDSPPRQVASAGFINHAQDFTLHNPTMTAVQGDQYTTYIQADLNIVPQIMSVLSQNIIQGAAHDSSARTPPPRCHPDTRVKVIARVTAWFNSQDLRKLLLWMTGPAGVGKSAIVQTFAEHLAKVKCLGASIFISRPNKRNNPNGIFITIAYQLATRIEAYRNFIVERLALDPQLLRGDMYAQFTTFIAEPFVERRIGAGGKRWGILLDGLDELQGEDAQCNIIQLISAFAHDHRDVPLLWIIASRPESHISNTFDDEDVRRSCWTEYIPIDSTEACQDVERFLRSSFKTTQKKFRHFVPSDWPSDADFLKLTAAASGLFVYAEVVMQFIRDSEYADPAARLGVLLSVIDRSTAVPTKDNPFVHLDALYHEILSSIPSALWPAAKQLLSFTIQEQGMPIIPLYILPDFHTLRGMSILFGLSRYTIYACLTKCRSTLKIPNWKVAHKQKLTFFHASFVDYLTDPSRSGDFSVANLQEVVTRVKFSLLEVWNWCSGGDVAIASVESAWHKYCSELDGGTPSRVVVKFQITLFRNIVYCLGRMPYSSLESRAFAELGKVHAAKLCYYCDSDGLVNFVINLGVLPKFHHRALYRETQLREITFGHLDWKEMSPASVRRSKLSNNDWVLHRPRSSAKLQAFISELENLQGRSPELKVVIFGGVLDGQVATFQTENQSVFYAIPYPE